MLLIFYFSAFLINFLLAPFNFPLSFFSVFLVSLAIYKREWLFLFFNSIVADIFSGGRFGFVFICLAFLLLFAYFSFKFVSSRRVYFILISSFIAVFYPASAYLLRKAILEKEFVLPNFISLPVFFWSVVFSYLIFAALNKIKLRV